MSHTPEHDSVLDAVDWKAMYMILCHGINDAITLCAEIGDGVDAVTNTLVAASLKAEDYYINVSCALAGEDRERSRIAETYMED